MLLKDEASKAVQQGRGMGHGASIKQLSAKQ
jgi:hypothetical protein